MPREPALNPMTLMLAMQDNSGEGIAHKNAALRSWFRTGLRWGKLGP